MVRKTVTLVFCDVADSTPLGERLDPETLREVWSRYHATARTVLERHGGTIEKFVGDAVMAAFGIPTVHEDDAVRAVRAAVELRGALAELNAELERELGVRLGVRTGVNTGEVVAGDPAQGQAFATGDAVVVAQRLEAAAGPGEILIGDSTFRLVRDAVAVEEIPPLELKGKPAPVAAWRLVDVLPGVAGVLRRLDSPLVGRSSELARLGLELGRAKAERSCRTITIVGEPGVGKSRLAAELVASLGEQATVLEGHCLPYGNGITYWPLVEVVRRLDLDAVLACADDREAVQGRILELIGRAEPRSRSDELYWAVRRLLEALARERPVVLILDDVQWAEPAFLDLVEYLAGWTRDAPVLVCCLARSEFAELRPAWPMLPLEPLGANEAAVLLENLTGPLDEAASRELRRAAGGNPLFLEEMVRMLAENDRLVERDGLVAAELGALPVPATIQAVLAARLDRLGAEERDVLQRAAVIGQLFWWGPVAELMPPERVGEVAVRLQALVRKGLVRPDRRTLAGEDGFRFAHILVRDAAYDSTPKRLRAELHERFADWLEPRAAERPELDEILGHHLEQAHVYRRELFPGDGHAALAERAAASLARAGRRALARADAHAAMNLLGRAVALTPVGSEDALELMLDASIAHHRAGQLTRSLELLDAVVAASPSPRLEWLARIERCFVLLYLGEGSTDDLLETAGRAADVFRDLGDAVGLARTWSAVGLELFIRGRYGQMEEAAAAALAHAREAGDARQEVSSLGAVAIALAMGPTPADAAAARVRELRDRAGELGSAALTTVVLASLEAMRANLDEAWELYDEAKRLLGDSGSRIPIAGLPLYAEPLLSLEPERAEAELRSAYALLEDVGERGVLPTVAAHLAEVLVQTGHGEEAEELTQLSERLAGPNDLFTQVVWRRARALALARGGGDGEGLAREAVRLARTTDSPHLLAGSLVVLGEASASPEPLVEARGLWAAKGHTAALALLDTARAAR